LIRVPTVFEYILLTLTPLYILILLVGTTIDYYVRGVFAVSDPLVVGARIAIILVLITGAIEAYYGISKKYGKELAENRKIIVVE